MFLTTPNLPKRSWGRIIPLGMHGDAAAFSHQDSLYVFSWNSLLGIGTTAQKRFVFTVVQKSDMVAGTLDRIFEIFAWSVNAMLAGQTPGVDACGRPVRGGGVALADGWRGALCQVRGDWAFFKEAFDFVQWNGAERMCFRCKASSTIQSVAWTDCGPRAGWRDTRWSHEGYLAFLRASGFAIPVLLMLVIGFRLECVAIDVLHTVDQGVASHIIGNILWHVGVVRAALGRGTIEEKVQLLDKDLARWYKETAAKSKLQGHLTEPRLRSNNGWPKLEGKGRSDPPHGGLRIAPRRQVCDPRGA